MSYNFDGEARVIQLQPGVFTVDARDLYSRWKEWSLNNLNYLQAFSLIGGDPLPDGTSIGITYFLENGWKIRPSSANQTLSVTGNLFSRDGSSPFLPTLGDFNVLIRQSVSNIIDQVNISGGSSGPSSGDIAQAVRNALNVELNRIDVNVSSRVSQSSFDSYITSFTNLISTIDDLVVSTASISSIIDTVNLNTSSALVDIQTLLQITDLCRKYASNRSRIDHVSRTLTIYEDDGVTPIRIFQLFDRNTNASVTEVFERVPQ